MSKQIRPKKIRLEASSICQLKCHSCPNANKAYLSTIGSGFLRLSDFQKLIDKNPWISEIELSNYGEIFLNPDLLEIIKYAYERKVALTAVNGANFNNVKTEVLEGLVRYKFRTVTASIDGASNETYKQYRIGGNYDTVIENIKKINLFKKQYKSKYPLLAWQFVIFGHNEHELPMARKKAYELNMYFYSKLSWDAEFSPVQNHEVIRKEHSAISWKEYKEKFGVDSYMQEICYHLWEQPQMNWDGKVLGCSENYWGDFGGDVFTDGLLESLNNEKINYARDMLVGLKEMRDDIPCATCNKYLATKKEGNWLKRGLKRRLISSIPSAFKFKIKRLFPPALKRIIDRLLYDKK
jgi:MoaA/NifB/PqqE/SkfB family radical SAM enzyme